MLTRETDFGRLKILFRLHPHGSMKYQGNFGFGIPEG